MKNQDRKTIRGWSVLIVAFCFCFGSIMAAQVAPAANADGTGDYGEDDQESSFANPAQAQHAANLAEEAASDPDAATLEAAAAVEEAESDLETALETGTEEEIAEAEKNLAEAQEAYAEAVEAHTGVLTGEISDMRAAGMGWGEIAQELGVHPGVLGLGHAKGKNKNAFADDQAADDEIGEATARNARSGWSKGHGVGLGGGVGEPSTAQAGLALGKSKGKSIAGISGAAGLSGKGNAGNSGNSGGGMGGGGKGKAGSDGSPGNSGGGKGAGDSGNGAEGGGKGGKGKGGGKGGK